MGASAMNNMLCALRYKTKAGLLLGIAMAVAFVIFAVPFFTRDKKNAMRIEHTMNTVAWVVGSLQTVAATVFAYVAALNSKVVDIQGWVVSKGYGTTYPLVLLCFASAITVLTLLSVKKMYHSSSCPSGKGIWAADTFAVYLFVLAAIKISWVLTMASLLLWIMFLVRLGFLYVVWTAPKQSAQANAMQTSAVRESRAERWKIFAVVGGAVLAVAILASIPFPIQAKTAAVVGMILLAILYVPLEKAVLSYKVCLIVGCCAAASGVSFLIAAAASGAAYPVVYWLFAAAGVAFGLLPKAK